MNNNAMQIDDSAVVEKVSQAIAPRTQDLLSDDGCKYRCGDCGFVNQLKLQDAIRCRACGFRVLYKIRTKRMVQFEAR